MLTQPYMSKDFDIGGERQSSLNLGLAGKNHALSRKATGTWKVSGVCKRSEVLREKKKSPLSLASCSQLPTEPFSFLCFFSLIQEFEAM